jgi:hypothetical protein
LPALYERVNDPLQLVLIHLPGLGELVLHRACYSPERFSSQLRGVVK